MYSTDYSYLLKVKIHFFYIFFSFIHIKHFHKTLGTFDHYKIIMFNFTITDASSRGVKDILDFTKFGFYAIKNMSNKMHRSSYRKLK